MQNSDYYPLNKRTSTFLVEGSLYKEIQNSFINVPVDYFYDEVGGSLSCLESSQVFNENDLTIFTGFIVSPYGEITGTEDW